MARFVFSFLLLLPYLCFHAHANAQATATPQAQKPNNLIATACQKSASEHFCIKILTNDPNTAKLSLKEYPFVPLRSAQKNVTDTAVLLMKSVTNTGLHLKPDLLVALKDCMGGYTMVMDTIDQILISSLSNKHDDAVKWTRAANEFLRSCDSEVKHFKDHIAAEVNIRNVQNRLTLSTFIDIVNNVKNQK